LPGEYYSEQPKSLQIDKEFVKGEPGDGNRRKSFPKGTPDRNQMRGAPNSKKRGRNGQTGKPWKRGGVAGFVRAGRARIGRFHQGIGKLKKKKTKKPKKGKNTVKEE